MPAASVQQESGGTRGCAAAHANSDGAQEERGTMLGAAGDAHRRVFGARQGHGAVPTCCTAGSARWTPASAWASVLVLVSATTIVPPVTEQISAQGLPGPEAASACDTVGAERQPEHRDEREPGGGAEQTANGVHGVHLNNDGACWLARPQAGGGHAHNRA